MTGLKDLVALLAKHDLALIGESLPEGEVVMCVMDKRWYPEEVGQPCVSFGMEDEDWDRSWADLVMVYINPAIQAIEYTRERIDKGEPA